MKQTLEEAAREELISSYAIVVEGELAYQRQAMLNMFKKGAEWQTEQSPWISVKERLPKLGKTVLVIYDYKGEIQIQPNCYAGQEDWRFDLHRILAWMPIPSFDEILEANRDVLERIKEKGD